MGLLVVIDSNLWRRRRRRRKWLCDWRGNKFIVLFVYIYKQHNTSPDCALRRWSWEGILLKNRLLRSLLKEIHQRQHMWDCFYDSAKISTLSWFAAAAAATVLTRSKEWMRLPDDKAGNCRKWKSFSFYAATFWLPGLVVWIVGRRQFILFISLEVFSSSSDFSTPLLPKGRDWALCRVGGFIFLWIRWCLRC